MKIKKENKNMTKGFTLIELMVASSIFAIIMLTLMGSLLMVFGYAKNARALRISMDNVNFAVESMTRSIRMGKNYRCIGRSEQVNILGEIVPQDCLEGGRLLVFTSQDSGKNIGYQMVTESGGPAGTDLHTGKKTLMRYDTSNPRGVPIVSSDVNIDKLNFIVQGSDPNDEKQPSVYVTMKGSVTIKGVPSSFSIQTMASQRNF